MNKKPFVLSLLLVVSVILAACGGAPSQPTQPPQATQPPAVTEPPAPTEPPAGPLVLKIANTANITTWDPVASFSTEAAYMANLYEQLLRINPPGSADAFTPLLAESWEKNADGTVWTFHLRQG